MSRFGSQVRQLFLLDNMSLTLALERSRSHQFGLLKQIRIFNAYCICRGIQPILDGSEVSLTAQMSLEGLVQMNLQNC